MARAVSESWRADESIFDRIRDRILGHGDPTDREDESTGPGVPAPS